MRTESLVYETNVTRKLFRLHNDATYLTNRSDFWPMLDPVWMEFILVFFKLWRFFVSNSWTERASVGIRSICSSEVLVFLLTWMHEFQDLFVCTTYRLFVYWQVMFVRKGFATLGTTKGFVSCMCSAMPKKCNYKYLDYSNNWKEYTVNISDKDALTWSEHFFYQKLFRNLGRDTWLR